MAHHTKVAHLFGVSLVHTTDVSDVVKERCEYDLIFVTFLLGQLCALYCMLQLGDSFAVFLLTILIIEGKYFQNGRGERDRLIHRRIFLYQIYGLYRCLSFFRL